MTEGHIPLPTEIVTETRALTELRATVIRCGCSEATLASSGQKNEAGEWLAPHTLEGLPCPTPRAVEDLGVLRGA